MNSFFAPRHVNLINACYPSSSVLLAPGSTFHPLPLELSQLIDYASNNVDTSAKLAKLGIELKKQASAKARKGKGGNVRARARLLVTISIFNALAKKCEHDIDVLSTALLSTTKDSLTCLPNNLELQARVANLFIAWANYTDGAIIGPDIQCTSDYINTLKLFRDQCIMTGEDVETVSRNQLIGLAAINAAIFSDAFFTSSKQFPKLFPKQVAIVVPALLNALHEAGIHAIKDKYKVILTDLPISPLHFSEFPLRPITRGRAASIHAHVDSETRPGLSDVINTSFRVLRTLIGRCNAAQLSIVFDSILQQVDKDNLWENIIISNWYAGHVIAWAQDQHRYAVPTLLVDKLLRIRVSHSSAKHFALVRILTCIFTSSKPMVNPTTSDILSNLVKVLLNRIGINSNDQLVLPLVKCISSLGTHVYSAYQINELTEEVVNRIVYVQTNWLPTQGRTGQRPAREVALRCLLSCLSGLPNAADEHAIKHDTKSTGDLSSNDKGISTGARSLLRNRVDLEQWQETLPLLCEPDYATRAMYARGLAAFIRTELEQEPFVHEEATGTSHRRSVRVSVDPQIKMSERSPYLNANPISRFLHALHAATFSLAMATCSVSIATTTWSSPPPEDRQSAKQYAILRRMIGAQSLVPMLSDFSFLRQVLTCALQQVPCRAVLTGVPMLVALAQSSRKLQGSIQYLGRLRATREMICHLWVVIGEIWDVPFIIECARTALESLHQTILPPLSDVSPTRLDPPEEPVYFPTPLDPLRLDAQGLVDIETVLPALASSTGLQAITGLDRQGLLRQFTIDWTVEGAVKESIEPTSMWGILRRLVGTSELKKQHGSRQNSMNNSHVPSRVGLHTNTSTPDIIPRAASMFRPSSNRNSRTSTNHSQSFEEDEHQAEDDQSSGSGSGEMSFAASRSSVASRAGYQSNHSSLYSVSSKPASAGPVLSSSSISRLPEILASIERSSRSRQASTTSTPLSSRQRFTQH